MRIVIAEEMKILSGDSLGQEGNRPESNLTADSVSQIGVSANIGTQQCIDHINSYPLPVIKKSVFVDRRIKSITKIESLHSLRFPQEKSNTKVQSIFYVQSDAFRFPYHHRTLENYN